MSIIVFLFPQKTNIWNFSIDMWNKRLYNEKVNTVIEFDIYFKNNF